jgi:PPOX class probable F420-dependent enzyme
MSAGVGWRGEELPLTVIDPATDHGQRVSERLRDEIVIWLTTVGKDGAPHPRPVWFLWENDSFLIYSQPNTAKLRHIARDNRVALNFNSTPDGGDVAVINGTAAIIDDAPPARDHQTYLDKYAGPIEDISMNPDSFAASYSVAIRVTPTKLWGF